jgi:hypothetical protein
MLLLPQETSLLPTLPSLACHLAMTLIIPMVNFTQSTCISPGMIYLSTDTHWLGPKYPVWIQTFSKHIWVKFTLDYCSNVAHSTHFESRLACLLYSHNLAPAEKEHVWVCWKDSKSRGQEKVEQIHIKHLLPAPPTAKSTAKKRVEVLVWVGEHAGTVVEPTDVPRAGAFHTALAGKPEGEEGEPMISFVLEGETVTVPRRTVVLVSDTKDAYRKSK